MEHETHIAKERKTQMNDPDTNNISASDALKLTPAEDASAPTSITTLADVLARLEAVPSRERRAVEMKSAIRKMGEVLRRSLIDTPADPAELRVLIAAASPASVGMSKERWSRVRSLTLAALRDLGVDIMPGRDIGGFSDAWKAMAAELPTKALRTGLSRFMSYCTRCGIEPSDASVEVFDAFHGALNSKSLRANPEAVYRSTVRRWNEAVGSVEGWPQVLVPLETHPHFYSLTWDSFPPDFVADVEAFLTKSGNRDELDELDDDYVSSVKPSTVALRRRQLRQLASVLVASGFPVDNVTALSVLVEPANALAALRFQRARQGGSITTSLEQQAWLLCTIARHWVKSSGEAAELSVIAGRLKAKQKGMTERNRTRLRQFDLDSNLAALLHLPATVLSQARREDTGDATEARRVLLATAIEFLIVAPMRVDNLTSMEHERHIVQFGRGRCRNRHIIIPAHETKTETLFEMILPSDSGAILDAYLKTFRSRVCSVPSEYLFPNSDGGRRSTVAFSRAISQFIEKETGLKMHAHLFRQLAGKIHLDANPSDIETVRRVLGHRTTATTARYYAEQRTGQAFQQYDRTIAGLRASSDSGTAAAAIRQREGANHASQH
jgi:integrase